MHDRLNDSRRESWERGALETQREDGNGKRIGTSVRVASSLAPGSSWWPSVFLSMKATRYVVFNERSLLVLALALLRLY